MNECQNPLASIIVPIYNAAPYLRECVDSLRGQTEKNIEILLIDDGSTDGSQAIMSEYQAKDQRIFCLETPYQSLGAGVARNMGLRNAHGKYAFFVDADDFFSEEMVRKAVQYAEAHAAEVVLFDSWAYDNDTHTVTSRAGGINYKYLHGKENDIFSATDIADSIMQITDGAAWGKLYKLEFLKNNGLEFQEEIIIDDMFFCKTTLMMARRIGVVKERLLYYRVNNCSSQYGENKHKLELCESYFQCFLAIKKFLVARNLEKTFGNSYNQVVMSEFYSAMLRLMNLADMQYLLERLKDSWFRELGIGKAEIDSCRNQFFRSLWQGLMHHTVDEFIFVFMRAGLKGARFGCVLKNIPSGKRIILYGAGKVGIDYFGQILQSAKFNLVAWTDRNAANLKKIGYPVIEVDAIRRVSFDYIIIAVENVEVADEIRSDLIEKFMIDADKILPVFPCLTAFYAD